MSELHAEWASLRAAMRAHVDWLADTGVDALRPCDEATLDERRARYRALAQESATEHSAPTAFASTELIGAEAPSSPASAEADPVPSVTAAPTERSPALPDERPGREVASVLVDVTPRADAAMRVATAVRADTAMQGDTNVRVDTAVRADTAAPVPSAPPIGAPHYSLPVAHTTRRASAPLPVASAGNTELAVHARDLGALAEEVKGCERCDLHRTRTQTVFARGTGSSGLCFIGEGPGADEDAQGVPFVGAAGQLLDKMITAMGLDRDEVYVCNIVKCRPPKNRKPERLEMQSCGGFLARQIELIAPKVIVALGGTAVEGLLGLSGIIRLRGQWRLYRGEIPVMPTFHPAYLLRQPEAKREVWNDLKLVLDHLGRPLPTR